MELISESKEAGAARDGAEHRERVLLVAYACRPGHGSEPGVGWNRAVEAARYFDTWVICEGSRCRGAIEQHEKQHGKVAGVNFVFLPTNRWERLLGAIPGLFYVAYSLWQRRAYRVAARLHAERPFALAHQVTYCGYREPGFLWKLDIPFIWGPFGGTQNTPWRFLRFIGPAGAAFESTRTLLNQLQLRFHRRIRAAARRATLLLAANTTNQRDFARIFRRTPTQHLETGLLRVAAQPKPRRDPSLPLRILWVGRCMPSKALPLLLHALSELPAEIRFELDILGDGSARPSWERMIDRLGLRSHVTWTNWLPHAEALARYQHADVFVFTSLRDTSGTVILEAFAAGLPVICLDHQGAHDMVTAESGIKIPVTTPEQVIAELRAAIIDLATDHDKLHALGVGAWEHAHDFLWSRQGERMAQFYRAALAGVPSTSA